MQILIKQSFSHINRAFAGWDTPQGRKVRDEAHYKELCKEQGMVPYEQAQEMAQKNAKGTPYKLSNESKALIKEAKKFKGSNGGFRASDCPELVDKMIKKGIVKSKGYGIEHLPSHLRREIK